MIIAAAVVLSAEGGVVVLNPVITTRDCFAYVISLVALLGALGLHSSGFNNNSWSSCLPVYWQTGFVFLLIYALYAFILAKFKSVCRLLGVDHAEELRTTTVIKKKDILVRDTISPQRSSAIDRKSTASPSVQHQQSRLEGRLNLRANPLENDWDAKNEKVVKKESTENAIEMPGNTEQVATVASLESQLESVEISDPESTTKSRTTCEKIISIWQRIIFSTDYYSAPKSILGKSVFYFFLPLKMSIAVTIPNLELPEKRKYYGLVAFESIIWIGILAEILLLCLEILGHLMGISDTVMGITISAMGASTPTLMSSISVASKGMGDMATSNALGNSLLINFISVLSFFLFLSNTTANFKC